ncbi:MAG: hypothetical protein AVDCRST_MAG19-4515 [uncultured Thermomicrobiales bacterium]|uniref:Uncharacterized protein n=1 Tax=uncultured Thermomicrobiales bacterium TaxID=1645740 RepID=A0A6J4VPG2_9BACT|nr:MAG: hypothetical protein AVDCRST_MAG19-4515 [uncultured Thermomicrobiales bacterium]
MPESQQGGHADLATMALLLGFAVWSGKRPRSGPRAAALRKAQTA